MSYRVLAQKYRPQTFDDVIGQEAVTRTLKNSVLRGRVANAYIFCGPRGVGKTSVARLLSKTLNCGGGAPEERPCDKCESCTEIARGNNIDVLEIDGASNRGIDEIRALRENVKFSPSRGTFKIYIIDEVHMLTPEAFNALLKTLEEPPEHVKFIFATTEPHKVLPTIMSRCQRFDFKRISPKMIFDRIADITRKEKIDIEEKAALLIARSADGSLRDALVILDQMVSFSGEKVIPDDVVELLGMVHRDKIFELSDAIIDGDSGCVAKILDELINNGKDPVFVTNSLMNYCRDLMILKTTGGAPTSDMAFDPDELGRFKTQIEKLSLDEILYILQNLSHCLVLMKGAMFTRAPLEITLIKLTRRRYALSLPDVLERLESLEKDLHKNTDVSPVPRKAPPSIKSDTIGSGEPRVDKPAERAQELAGNEEAENNVSDVVEFNASKFHWKAVLNYVKDKKMSVFTFLSAGTPVEFSENKVVIGFDKEHAFNKEALEVNGRDVIEEAIRKVTGKPVKLEFTILEFLGKEAEEKGDGDKEKIKAREKIKPVIEEAMDVFGGNIVQDITEEE